MRVSARSDARSLSGCTIGCHITLTFHAENSKQPAPLLLCGGLFSLSVCSLYSWRLAPVASLLTDAPRAPVCHIIPYRKYLIMYISFCALTLPLGPLAAREYGWLRCTPLYTSGLLNTLTVRSSSVSRVGLSHIWAPSCVTVYSGGCKPSPASDLWYTFEPC